MKSPGSIFLHEKNPQLHASQEVEDVVSYLRAGGEQVPNEPSAKLDNYLGFLANKDYVNDGILTGDQASIDRQIAAHVIKAEDVPESYFELQKRIVREQGHGDVELTSELKSQLIEAVQTDQRTGLAKWVEYLGGDDGSYPDWFKFYTWNSVTKLGNFDKEKGAFLKRSKGTTAPYPELNREALAYVFDAVNKKAHGEQPNANDEQLQQLLHVSNFGKLYAHAVLRLQPATAEQKKYTEGSWTKYDQSDDPRRARRLSDSLQSHGTGWCTAGESTAAAQLKLGDFYVYYSRDEEGKDTVPRVAIRMQQGEVAEVRGINAQQELEPVMADITMERLKDLPGGEAYIQRAEDMKRLTALDRKLADNPEAELSKDELIFLYELERHIEGFGYDQDPRIQELKSKREVKKDMATLLDTDPEDGDATLAAMAEAFEVYKPNVKRKKYVNLPMQQVLNGYTGLSPKTAQILIDTNMQHFVGSYLSSFNGLNDDIAQQIIPLIQGSDLSNFTDLSEDTFYALAKQFSGDRSTRNIDSPTRGTIWQLIKNIDRFSLPDHQNIADFFMDEGHWLEVGSLPQYFTDLNTGAIADRLLNAGGRDGVVAVAHNLEGFPTVDHEQLAERLLQVEPRRLAMYLAKLNVDKNAYAHRLIEAGLVGELVGYPGESDDFDREVVARIEVEKAAQAERREASRKSEEEIKRRVKEAERDYAERLDDWDDTYGE